VTAITMNVPDIGGSEDVDIIEICVKVGDVIAEGDSLIVLETDKASMEVPATEGGVVTKVLLKEGDTCSEGTAILELRSASAAAEAAPAPAPVAAPAAAPAPAPAAAPVAGSVEPVIVPDIGGSENVDVIEVCVKAGDTIAEGDSLIVLETDKASMEVPAPKGGVVKSINIKEGDTVNEGDLILELEVAGGAVASAPAAAAPVAAAPAVAAVPAPAPVPAPVAGGVEPVIVPDIGGSENVDVIEVCVKAGDTIAEGDSLIVLETDKASMEVPAPKGGVVKSISIKEGDTVNEGDLILELEVAGSAVAAAVSVSASASAPAPVAAPVAAAAPAAAAPVAAPATKDLAKLEQANKNVHAGPAVRGIAREFGVDLTQVKGSGPKGRILKEDVQAYVKETLAAAAKPKAATAAAVTGGSGIPAIPAIDFSKFGEIELEKMSKIKKLTAANMTRCWLNIPHVTQFDDIDITELEKFRADIKADAEKAGVRVTPLPFLLKAVAAALKAHPNFNVSMHSDGEHIVHKKYINIGVAMDTPAGLMVPVIKDVDKKSIYQLAAEAAELGAKAKARKLTPAEMQGGCFTISSLGNIGGTGFTPIVSAPEVGILGVSRADIKPVWNGKEFVPRKMLPLALSYDHRAINGVDAGMFMTTLGKLLSDVRRLVL
jgi:pyruvate dehydrogenase E2 component (dihydrolipoamide acetyltransferase)